MSNQQLRLTEQQTIVHTTPELAAETRSVDVHGNGQAFDNQSMYMLMG